MLGNTAESQETQRRVHRADAMSRSLLFKIGTTGLWSVMMQTLSNQIDILRHFHSTTPQPRVLVLSVSIFSASIIVRVTMASGLYMPSRSCIIVPPMPLLHKYQYSAYLWKREMKISVHSKYEINLDHLREMVGERKREREGGRVSIFTLLLNC